MGLRIAKGKWEYKLMDSKSTATFVEGSAVGLAPDRTVIEYASTQSQWLGIALHSSVNSLQAPGKVNVAIPDGGFCTMWVPMATNLAASALSIGAPVGLAKSGNTFDQLDSAPQASAFSRIGLIYGKPVLSPLSQIEVALTNTAGVWFSSSTITAVT